MLVNLLIILSNILIFRLGVIKLSVERVELGEILEASEIKPSFY